MRRWTGLALVHVMPYYLFGAKPLPEPTRAYCQLDPYEQTPGKLKSKLYELVIHENAFEYVVCEMAYKRTLQMIIFKDFGVISMISRPVSQAGISNCIHPTAYCGMQLLIPAWDTCFWHQRAPCSFAGCDFCCMTSQWCIMCPFGRNISHPNFIWTFEYCSKTTAQF